MAEPATAAETQPEQPEQQQPEQQQQQKPKRRRRRKKKGGAAAAAAAADAEPQEPEADTARRAPGLCRYVREVYAPRPPVRVEGCGNPVLDEYGDIVSDDEDEDDGEAEPLHLRAARDFAVGEEVLTEVPFTFVVTDECAATRCHLCLRAAPQMMQCNDCKFARYCSKECVIEAGRVHSLECDVLARLGEVREHGPAYGTTTEQIRTVLRLQVLRALEAAGPQRPATAKERLQEKVRERAGTPARAAALTGDVMELSSRTDAIGRMERGEMMLQAHALSQITERDALRLDEADGVEVFFRMRHNTTCVEDGRRTVAHAVCPLVSLARNSCAPNTVLSFADDGAPSAGARGRATLRAVRPIRAGEPVTRALVSLYQVEIVRRYQLRNVHGVERCGCERCEAAADQAPDRHIGGFACKKCETEPRSEMRLWELPEGRKDFSGWVECSNDECDGRVQVGHFLDAETACENALTEALGKAGPDATAEELREARETVEEAVVRSENGRMLDSAHSLHMDAGLMLASVCGRLGDHLAQASYARAAAAAQRRAFGDFGSPDLAFALNLLGQALRAHLAGDDGTADESKEEREKLRAEADEAFLEAARIRLACFGPDHSLARASLALLGEAARASLLAGGPATKRRRRRGGRGRRRKKAGAADEAEAGAEEETAEQQADEAAAGNAAE